MYYNITPVELTSRKLSNVSPCNGYRPIFLLWLFPIYFWLLQTPIATPRHTIGSSCTQTHTTTTQSEELEDKEIGFGSEMEDEEVDEEVERFEKAFGK